jgi:glycosyltransferase involved in cell wall biosynthesis
MKLSIVIPVFNSENILERLVGDITKTLNKKKILYEILLVNDCSKDKSWEKIKYLKKKNKFLKGINLKNNYGQHSAIFCGLKFCSGKYIVCMDDDMQHNPKYIPSMVDELEENYDVCYVKFKAREHSLLKTIISYTNHVVSSFLMNKPISIYSSSYKSLKKNIVKKIISNNQNYIFLDYWIFKYTNKITYINIIHNKRLKGKTNYGLKEMLTLWFNMIFLIESKKKNVQTLFVFFFRVIFKFFFKNYLGNNQNKKIIISEKLF